MRLRDAPEEADDGMVGEGGIGAVACSRGRIIGAAEEGEMP